MKKKIIAWTLLLGWLLVIFFFSAQTSGESTHVSNGLLHVLEQVTHVPLTSPIWSFAIRKIAHFSEYAVLGALWMNLLRVYQKLSTRNMIFISLLCLFYAASDEIHQIFVSGRSAQILDVCIDILGSIFGILFYQFIYQLKK